MKIIRNISALGFALMTLIACDSNLDTVTYNEGDAQAAVLDNLSDSYVLDPSQADDLITFNWTQPNMGYSAQATTTLQMVMTGDSFDDDAVTLSASKTDTEYSISIEDLNNKIITILSNKGLDLDATYDFEFRLSSSISDAVSPIYSNVVTTSITPYTAEREYPKVWIIGDYCGWSHDNSQFLFSFAEDANYEGVIDFSAAAANGFKVTGIAGWEDSSNWGTDGDATAPSAEAASVQLIASGGSGNISCYSKRFYHFGFNTTTLLLKKDYSFDQLGIVGDGVGSWDNDVVMDFDAATQKFYVDVTLVTGEIKFRTDASWSTNNWGSSDEDGVLSSGGNNIAVTAGNYRIYVNLNNTNKPTYTLSTEDYGI